MPLNSKEEIALRAAFMAIQIERTQALRAMFKGTQLKPKSLVQDAKELAKEAKKAKKLASNIPGISTPNLEIPSLNVDLFRGINLRNLVDINIPGLTMPNLNLIPDIRLGDLPGFNLPSVRLNLKGILKYKDLFPNISLRALIWSISIKYPHLNFPAIAWDVCNIFGLNIHIVMPKLKIEFPEFFKLDLKVKLPNLKLPDIDLPDVVPNLDINLPNIDLSALVIHLKLPKKILNIPGIDKVLKLLLELFDAVDLPDIIAELGLDFLQDFISGALPIVQQVKSGAQATHSWGKAAQELHKSLKVKKHMPFILRGDARDACIAVRSLLRESSAEYAVVATIQTTQFAVSTAGLFADLGGVTGPATSAAASVAKLCQKITIFAVKYKQMKKVNLILRTVPGKALSSDIFNISPLLGCYYLANSTTSNCLNILCDNILEDNWMADAEKNKRQHLDPLIKDSQRFIHKSRYVLNPIRQNKGMYVEKSSFQKLKEGFSLSVKKKLRLASKTETIKSHRYIG